MSKKRTERVKAVKLTLCQWNELFCILSDARQWNDYKGYSQCARDVTKMKDEIYRQLGGEQVISDAFEHDYPTPMQRERS